MTICFFAVVTAIAQVPKRLRFEILTSNNGLSQGLVTSIIQDKTGFMWFGTNDGLNKYDGYQFTVYRNIPENPNTIADDGIQSIFEDSKGRLWIGTAYRGLEMFDRKRGTFSHIPHSGENSPASNDIRDISEDNLGNLWLRTTKGIDRLTVLPKKTLASADTSFLQKNTFQFLHIRTGFEARAGADHAQTILACRDGRIYLTTQTGILQVFIDNQKPGAYRFKKEYEFFEILGNPAPMLLEDTISHSIFLVNGGQIMKFVNHDFSRPEKIRQSDNIVIARTIDKQGNLWVEDQGKFILINAVTGKSETVQTDAPLFRSAENTLTHYTDPSGVIWMATGGFGILKYHPARDYFHHELEGTNTYQILAGQRGELVLNGRFKYQPGSLLKNPLMPDKSLLNEPDWQLNATKDNQGIVWVNIQNGLISFNSNNGELRTFKSTEKPFKPFPLFTDKAQNIWIGSDSLLVKFSSNSHSFDYFSIPLANGVSGYDFVQSILQDDQGFIWLGTVSGIRRFDPQKKTWQIFRHSIGERTSLSNNFVLSLSNDVSKSEHLWIGTKGGGLNRLDKSTGKFTRFAVENGLPNNVVYGILQDHSGNLWMSTNRGISQFDRKNTFRNFTVADGLQDNEFNRYAYAKRNDTLFFGGLNGINYFVPEQINALGAPRVFLTGFKLFNKHVDFLKEGSPIKTDISYTEKIRLAYNQNMIGLTFSAADYHTTGQVQYRYQLEGFDKDWIYQPSSHEATYTNLDPGTYQFYLEASLDGIQWGAKQNLITIEIVAPFWKTWLFYLLVATFLGAIVYAAYRYRLRQILRLQHLRNRISRDLHDEIGSSLSTISIYSKVAYEQLKTNAQNPQALLEKISENTDQAMEAMDDIIWSTNADNDIFENIINRMREHAVQLFEVKGYQLHFTADEGIVGTRLDMGKRKDFYLIYKEALNNIAKHAQGHNVWIDVSGQGRTILLTIRDDGRGFDASKKAFGGNGLGNMHTRAAALGGNIKMTSSPGSGSRLDLQFPSQ